MCVHVLYSCYTFGQYWSFSKSFRFSLILYLILSSYFVHTYIEFSFSFFPMATSALIPSSRRHWIELRNPNRELFEMIIKYIFFTYLCEWWVWEQAWAQDSTALATLKRRWGLNSDWNWHWGKTRRRRRRTKNGSWPMPLGCVWLRTGAKGWVGLCYRIVYKRIKDAKENKRKMEMETTKCYIRLSIWTKWGNQLNQMCNTWLFILFLVEFGLLQSVGWTIIIYS